VTATTLRDLLQQAIDKRRQDELDASMRALQEAVEAEESERPRGLALNRTTASQILKRTYKREPTPGTIRAIAWLAGVGEDVAFTAAGRRTPGVPFVLDLPPGVDDLSPKERTAVVEVLRVIVAQRQEINRYVDQTQGHRSPASAGTPTEARSAQEDALYEAQRDWAAGWGDTPLGEEPGVDRNKDGKKAHDLWSGQIRRFYPRHDLIQFPQHVRSEEIASLFVAGDIEHGIHASGKLLGCFGSFLRLIA
jgi:hypothetical protein